MGNVPLPSERHYPLRQRVTFNAPQARAPPTATAPAIGQAMVVTVVVVNPSQPATPQAGTAEVRVATVTELAVAEAAAAVVITERAALSAKFREKSSSESMGVLFVKGSFWRVELDSFLRFLIGREFWLVHAHGADVLVSGGQLLWWRRRRLWRNRRCSRPEACPVSRRAEELGNQARKQSPILPMRVYPNRSGRRRG